MGDPRQEQVKGTRETSRLRDFMKEGANIEISEGFTKIVEHMNELSTKCSLELCPDARKIDYLRKAITELQNWSRIPVQNITSQVYSFNTFLTTLY